MDPLIALALAGNVLQFVDTARSVVSRGLEVYTSIDGTTSQDADAEFVTNDLLRLVQRLSFSNQINTQCPELAALCSRCVDVSKELVASIARIKGDGRAGRWPSLKRALMRFWNEKEIMSMEKRILAIQAEYHLRVSVDIKQELESLSFRHTKAYETLDNRLKVLVDNLMDQHGRVEASLAAQTGQISNTKDTMLEQHEETRKAIIQNQEQHFGRIEQQQLDSNAQIISTRHMVEIYAAELSQQQQNMKEVHHRINHMQQRIENLEIKNQEAGQKIEHLTSQLSKTTNEQKKRSLIQVINDTTAGIIGEQATIDILKADRASIIMGTIWSKAAETVDQFKGETTWKTSAYPKPVKRKVSLDAIRAVNTTSLEEKHLHRKKPVAVSPLQVEAASSPLYRPVHSDIWVAYRTSKRPSP